ncbi:MAG: tetratricopeptide repeat protein [Chloroflexota bacterium]
MSKRSSRRKRKQIQQRQQKPAVLVQHGLNAFRQADYDAAVKAWELAQGKPNTPAELPAALAEAYFRRAVTASAARLSDLQQAVKLAPADPRYRYHLALAYHRQGELDLAEPLYRQLLAESPPFERAAAPLAQLLIEQKKAVIKDPVWPRLSLETRVQLAAAEALCKRKADSTLHQLAQKSLEPLWAGLLALALADNAAAQQYLHTTLANGTALHPLARGVAHYYLGVIAAAAGQTGAALEHWQAAQAGGLDSRHLKDNLAVLTSQQALAAWQAGQPERAAGLLEHVAPEAQDLREFRQQLNWELGYTAAQKGEWSRAVSFWETAEKGGDDSRRLVYNLALAYQHTNRFQQAAEYWRTLLRRRPRKADHPDALTDQQVARIWQNVAENYAKADDYEEAITTYKNAVKWAPDNIDLRLKLVETYQTEGRWQAAENELHRILEKEPDHVPALTLLAESYSEGYYAGQARRLWRRILELEPQNPVARQQLAHSYEREGYNMIMWGHPKRAIEIYQEGLKHVPDSQRLLVMLGGTYVDMKKLKEGRQYLEQARAINPNDLHTLHTIFRIWLEYDNPKEASQTFEHIKAVTAPVPGGFFLDLFQQAYHFEYTDIARQVLEYAEERHGQDDNLLVDVAVGYRTLEQTQHAMALLRRVLHHNPDHIEANIHVGMLYYEMEQTRLAKRHWQTAEAQAHRENNQLELHRIKLIKDEFLYGKPPPRNPIEMLLNLPPQLREQLLKTAPPGVAEMLRDMTPEMLEELLNLGGFPDFDDELDDEFYL